MTTAQEDNFWGKFASYEPGKDRITPLAHNNEELGISYQSWQYAASGLTAIWAESNTRGDLFDAMERREAYATTGTRIRLRFFGGWDFAPVDARRRDQARIGYAKGVPMGGDLPARPAEATSPTFLVLALRDPMGANLDRVQIIKGWLDADGNPQDKVYDVAWSDNRQPGPDGKLPPVGNTVDLSVPTWSNTIGASELGTVWTDPDFDPEVQAFYYARVIEIPTPRWTAYDVVKNGIEPGPDVKLITQDRAYSSPIWYERK
jgi:hypothetical protein